MLGPDVFGAAHEAVEQGEEATGTEDGTEGVQAAGAAFSFAITARTGPPRGEAGRSASCSSGPVRAVGGMPLLKAGIDLG